MAKRVIAPAKVNLALHVLGRRDDGYHDLASLVAFTEFGDTLDITASNSPSVNFGGEFARGLDPANNSILAAMRWFQARFGVAIDFQINCQKLIPTAAGLGGGTADAAAILGWLFDHYQIKRPPPAELAGLGADVPVSFYGKAAMMRGIGDDLSPIALDRDWGIVLCNPRVQLSTGSIFAALDGFDTDIMPRAIWHLADLARTRNSLSNPAVTLAPMISGRLVALEELGGYFVRMSGSGASLFALTDQPQKLAARYQARFPGDWVRPSYIKRATT